MNRLWILVVMITTCLISSLGFSQTPLGSGFTYQGRYEVGGVPFDGFVTLRFSLWDSPGSGQPPVGGHQIGGSQELTDTPVLEGVFTVILNASGEFGPDAFVGESRWLEVGICAVDGCEAPEILAPRQPITAIPFSHFSTTSNSSYWPNLINMPEGFADGFDNAGDSYWFNDGGNLSYIGGLVGIGTTQPNATSRLNVVNIAASQWAIRGDAASGGIGVAGISPGGTNARGVYGTVGPDGYCGTSGDHSGSGNYGLLGTAGEGVFANSPSGNGVRGVANTGIGVWGSSETNVGVYGTSNSSNGVSGGSGSASGVYGISSTGYGVYGTSPTNVGVRGESDSDIGVSGHSVSYIGIEGTSDASYGVFGYSSVGIGVRGQSGNAVQVFPGVWGEGLTGVKATGTGPSGVGIHAEGGSKAGVFAGDIVVDGEVNTPVFKVVVDHPSDPENKYFSHSSVESSEMKTFYDGTVVTDSEGFAEVVLPDWFEVFNKDLRYQLTVIGQFAQAMVSKEVENNSFEIQTDSPNVKVSWQVTGVRNDPYAKAHPNEIEQLKKSKDQGKYLNPEVYGQPKEKGIHYRADLEKVSSASTSTAK